MVAGCAADAGRRLRHRNVQAVTNRGPKLLQQGVPTFLFSLSSSQPSADRFTSGRPPASETGGEKASIVSNWAPVERKQPFFSFLF